MSTSKKQMDPKFQHLQRKTFVIQCPLLVTTAASYCVLQYLYKLDSISIHAKLSIASAVSYTNKSLRWSIITANPPTNKRKKQPNATAVSTTAHRSRIESYQSRSGSALTKPEAKCSEGATPGPDGPMKLAQSSINPQVIGGLELAKSSPSAEW